MRLQYLHGMGTQKFMNRIFRVFQICQLPGARRANLAAGGGQTLGDAVIAERAFLRRVRLRVDEPASVRAGLHTVTASEAIVLINENDSIRADEGGANGANLRARRIRTVITELGDKEVFAADVLIQRKSLLASIWRLHFRTLDRVVSDVVALDPGAEVAVRDVVFLRAGPNATAAADALGNVDQHPPPVIGEFVIGGGFGRASLNVFPGNGGSRQEEQEAASGDVHYRLPPAVVFACVPSIFGRCG